MRGVVQPQEIVLVHVLFADGVDDQPAARFQVLQCLNDRFPHWRGVDDGVQFLGRFLCGIAGPDSLKLYRKRPFLWASGKYEDFGLRVSVSYHLQHKVT